VYDMLAAYACVAIMYAHRMHVSSLLDIDDALVSSVIDDAFISSFIDDALSLHHRCIEYRGYRLQRVGDRV
jgi:hypothetical protein